MNSCLRGNDKRRFFDRLFSLIKHRESADEYKSADEENHGGFDQTLSERRRVAAWILTT